MAAPGEFLDWTNGTAPAVLDPPAGQKSAGWAPNQKPPFQYLNWLFYQTDQWLKYLAGVVYQGQQTYTANVTWDGLTRTQLLNPTGGLFTFTLPLAVNYGGQRVVVKNIAALGSNNVNVVPSGSDTIEGSLVTYPLTPLDNLMFEAQASTNTWWLVG